MGHVGPRVAGLGVPRAHPRTMTGPDAGARARARAGASSSTAHARHEELESRARVEDFRTALRSCATVDRNKSPG